MAIILRPIDLITKKLAGDAYKRYTYKKNMYWTFDFYFRMFLLYA